MLRLCRKITANGRTVLAVLHDLNQAARYADELVVMHRGAIVAQGHPSGTHHAADHRRFRDGVHDRIRSVERDTYGRYPSPTSTSRWLVLISHGTNAAQCLKFAVTEVRLEMFQGLIAESLAIDILDDGWRTLFCQQ